MARKATGIVIERGTQYGPAKGPNLARIARLWSAYLDTDVSPHDVAWMFVLVKASRSKQAPGHPDNYVDAVGYVDIAEEWSK